MEGHRPLQEQRRWADGLFCLCGQFPFPHWITWKWSLLYSVERNFIIFFGRKKKTERKKRKNWEEITLSKRKKNQWLIQWLKNRCTKIEQGRSVMACEVCLWAMPFPTWITWKWSLLYSVEETRLYSLERNHPVKEEKEQMTNSVVENCCTKMEGKSFGLPVNRVLKANSCVAFQITASTLCSAC